MSSERKYPEREKYEWTRQWWEEARLNGDRALVIGDSITNGYRDHVQKRLEGQFFVDMLATSHFVADPCFEKELRFCLEQYSYQAIHFNNGLHGIELSNEEYEEAYRRMAALVLSYCPNVIITTSTPITKIGDPTAYWEERNAVVLARNAIVKKIAEDCRLPVDDLYAAAEGKADIRSDDGYHYTKDGYLYLSEFVAEAIKKSAGK